MRRWLTSAAFGLALLSTVAWAQRGGHAGGMGGVHGGYAGVPAGGYAGRPIGGYTGRPAGAYAAGPMAGYAGRPIGYGGYVGAIPGRGYMAGTPMHAGTATGSWAWRYPVNHPYPYRYPYRCCFGFGFRYGWWYPFYGYAGWYSYPGYWSYGYPGYNYSYPSYSYPTYSYNDTYPLPSYPTYDDSGQSAQYDLEQQQQIDQLNDKVARLEAQQQARNAAPSSGQPEVIRGQAVLIFRDKHSEQIQNYAIVGKTIWVFNEERARKIPITELDVPATNKANEDRGMDLHLSQ